MKVRMLAYVFYDNDTRIMQYASALIERGDTVDVIALRWSGQPTHSVVTGVNVFRIRARTINERGALSYLYRMTRFLKCPQGFSPGDICTALSVHPRPFRSGLPGLRCRSPENHQDTHNSMSCLSLREKCHVTRESVLSRFLVLAERCSIPFANHVIVANHWWAVRVASRSTAPDEPNRALACSFEDVIFPNT